MSSLKDYLNLNNMTKRNNTVGLKTPILEWKTPRHRVAKFFKGAPLNIFIPTSNTLEHGGTGAESFNLDPKIADSNCRTDEQTFKAFKVSDGTRIDSANITINYDNSQVDIEHNTQEDIYGYYYSKEGIISIEVYRPSGAGVNNRILFDNSLLKIHSVDQIQSVSPLTLSTGWDLPQKHIIRVNLLADYQVDWLSDNEDIASDKLGLVNIPYRMTQLQKYTREELAKVNRRYSI